MSKDQERLWERLLKDHQYAEARALIGGLAETATAISRRSTLAFIDLLETGTFDGDAYEAAVLELTDPEERRFWTAGLAVAMSYEAFLRDEDFRDPLTRAYGDVRPLHLKWSARLWLFWARFGPARLPLFPAAACLLIPR